jgi:hypothetical protein
MEVQESATVWVAWVKGKCTAQHLEGSKRGHGSTHSLHLNCNCVQSTIAVPFEVHIQTHDQREYRSSSQSLGSCN